jgi:hypothetical protein
MLLRACPVCVQSLASKESLVGSWPGAGKQQGGPADAALPFFPGRPIRTNSSTFSGGMQGPGAGGGGGGVQRTHSFNDGGSSHPASTRANVGMDGGGGGSFNADQLCFGGCSSAPITPRSPSYTGYDEVCVCVGGGGAAAAGCVGRSDPGYARASSSACAH